MGRICELLDCGVLVSAKFQRIRLVELLNINPFLSLRAKKIIMKNISLFLNVVLTIAVAFLFYKVYSKKEVVTAPSVSASVPVSESSIVYVNSDSLLDNYPFFTQIKNSLEKKQDSIENILKNRGRSLENDIKAYQEKGAGM